MLNFRRAFKSRKIIIILSFAKINLQVFKKIIEFTKTTKRISTL